MGSERNIVDDLIKLAMDRSVEGRRLLVKNIADLYISDEDRLNDHERTLMNEILSKLLGDIEVEVKSELSQRLADLDNVPEELLVTLGKDDIAVARPILEKSKILKDPALIEIVRQRTDEHRMAIALRHGISPEVAEALVIYGDEDVIEALLRNQDADISRSAMEYLVAESERVDRFQEPLICRHDLPPEFAHRMFWWVSAALRRHIILNFKMDQVELDEAIQDATRLVLERMGAAEGAADKTLALITQMKKKGELDFAFLIRALRQQRTSLFVTGLAVLAEVPVNMAWRIFSDRGGESLTVALKAIGMGRSDFAALLLLVFQARSGGQTQDAGVLKKVMELYDKVDQKSALGALSYWRRDLGYQTAIDALEDA